MSKKIELDPGKAALLNKKVEQIRETIKLNRRCAMRRRNEIHPEREALREALVEEKTAQIQETILYAIKRDGRSDQEIGMDAGLSKTTVRTVKSGKLSLRVLILLAEELGLDIIIQEKEGKDTDERGDH